VRRIEFQAFRRSDGLFEVEARLIDRKPHDFELPSTSKTIPANTPIHDLGVCVVFDRDMVIRAVHPAARAYPYRDCLHGGDALQVLVGVRIGPGWNRVLRTQLPASENCTHLKEMLSGLATVAYQAMASERPDLFDTTAPDGRPGKVDSCHAYGATRELVLQRWPSYHRKV
jgi:hypothetical protein